MYFQYDFDLHPTNTFMAMEKLVEMRLVRSLGVSNFNSEQLADIMSKCKVKLTVNQVECHPHYNQNKLIEFCKEQKVEIQSYSPLGSPARSWAPADEVKLLDEPKLVEIGKAHKKSVGQILVRYQVSTFY